MIRGLARIVLYVALGPFVGTVGALLAIGVAALLRFGELSDGSIWEALFSPQILGVSYLLGALPALLTAVVSIVIAPRISGWRHWLLAALSGALLTAILAWLVFGTAPISEGLMPIVFTAVIAAAGALGGLVCAALHDALAVLFGRR